MGPSRVIALVDKINEGVKNGYISEEERTRLMKSPIRCMDDFYRLEEQVVQYTNVEN